MFGRNAHVAVLAALAVTMPFEASAVNLGGSGLALKRLHRPFVPEKGFAMAPMGHIAFCMNNPDECVRPARFEARIALDADHLAELRQVNADVNGSIRPVNDAPSSPLGDDWRVNVKAGDCEDFALTKRSRLIAKGWPANHLRVAIGNTASGEGHAVLVVSTTGGDYILDNRSNAILPWHESDVRLISIQSVADPRFWRSL
jgi:predicted transglutaminase-like cysteine proteinase